MNFASFFRRRFSVIYMSKEVLVLDTLSSHTETFSSLSQKIRRKGQNINRQYPAAFLERFRAFNKQSFQFLHLTVSLFDEDKILIESSAFCGRAPLISPVSGKPIGEIHVKGRYGEEFSSFLQLSDNEDILEFNENLPISDDSLIKAPIAYTCAQFVNELMNFSYQKWRKFTSEERREARPASATQWQKYARQVYDPRKALEYPNRKNALTPLHHEWQEILYAFSLAFQIVTGSAAPSRMRSRYLAHQAKAQQLLHQGGTKATSCIRISKKDNAEVQHLKKSANEVLKSVRSQHRAWRFNCALVYERYVQFVFGRLAQRHGARVQNNPRFPLRSAQAPAWSLSHLEPDMLVTFPQRTWVVDAKYKSHMLNIQHHSASLTETFRADLHQVMAYGTMLPEGGHEAFLVYPATGLSVRTIQCTAPGYHTEFVIHLVGLKVDFEQVNTIVDDLKQLLRQED